MHAPTRGVAGLCTVTLLLATVVFAVNATHDDLKGARGFIDRGQYAEGEAAARAWLARAEAGDGKDSLDAARAIDLIVEAELSLGKARELGTQELAARGLSIRETRLGPDHPLVATSLTNMALIKRKIGDLEEARRLLDRALSIRERTQGPRHPDTAATLDELADVLQTMGDYRQARQSYERALAIQEESLGLWHPDVARTLNGLAIMLIDLGDYDGAKSSFQRALAIRLKALGSEHPLTIQLLNNLALLLADIGDYAEALPLHEQVLEQWSVKLGPTNPAVGAASFNLANLYEQMGDYDSARPLYERALSIWEHVNGREHSRVARVLNSLGAMLFQIGDCAAARPLLEQALSITVNSPGSDDLLRADIMSNLGSVARISGDSDRARSLLDKALALRTGVLEPDNPQVAETLLTIAFLSLEAGRGDEATQLFERVLDIQEAALGPSHPFLTETLTGFSRAVASAGSTTRALSLALRAEDIGREHLRLTIRSLGEVRALHFAAVRGSGLDQALSLAARSPNPIVHREVWDAVIRSRALVLDEIVERRRRLAGAFDFSTVGLASDFTSASSRYAQLLLRGPGEMDSDVYRRLLLDARNDMDRAEASLASRSAGFRSARERDSIGLEDVQSHLPTHSALVSYALVHEPPKAGPDASSPAADVYFAFVLNADTGSASLVPVGRADQVERLLARWHEEVQRAPRGLSRPGDAREVAYRKAGEALRHAVWDPVTPMVGDAERAFIVPDGVLGYLNFATLPTPDGRFLLETGPVLHYLSARDVVPAVGGTSGSGLLIMGDPDFSVAEGNGTHGPSTAAVAPRQGTGDPRRPPVRGTNTPCMDRKMLSFERLPGARNEVEGIAALWRRRYPGGDAAARPEDVLLLTGRSAGERALRIRAPGRRVVHLATHGFFLKDSCGRTRAGSYGVQSDCGNGLAGPDRAHSPDVSLLSGLAMAGANRRGHHADAGDGEDGILMAEEAATLDLSGVEWVVLSACETGVGAIWRWEGMLGLRRSFQRAGARTLIMSLWRVRDEEAREWMSELYSRRLSGASTADAVHEASLALLQTQRRSGGDRHPFTWGAFVATGDWR